MHPQVFREIEGEVTALLSDLIRINTANPPGNETEAAKYLTATLEKDGFKCEFFESVPNRGSVITHLQGTGEKPSVLLLSHLDVVPADPSEWSVDPFAGVVKDGFVWGRGALDMKSMTAMEVVVLKLLKRNGVKLKSNVVLAATADEEKGGEQGAGWLASNHPEKVHADYVINEGGGQAFPVNRKNIYTIQTAEKGIFWFKIKAKGTPGHGSVPGNADNAIMRMNRIIERLGNHRAKISLVAAVEQFLTEMARENVALREDLTSLLQNPAAADQVLDKLAEKDKAIAEEIRAKVRMTIAPTMIHGGTKENIIPSHCETVFDCRILPGQTPAEAMTEIIGLLSKGDLENMEFETIQANEPSESPRNTPLYEVIANVLKEYEPNCSVAPSLLTGGTDSRFFRKLGSVCYGFQPMRSDLPYGEISKMIHGIDERISVENLVYGASVLYTVLERFAT